MNRDCPQECLKVRQHLVLFAGRDLEEPLCVQVEQHLAVCAECRAELELSLAAQKRIGVFGAENARGLEAVDLWPEVLASVRREREAARTEVAALQQVLRPSRGATLRRLAPLSLAAAAALLIALGFLHESAAISEPELPPGMPPGMPIVKTPPVVPAPDVAVNDSVPVRVETVSSGSLRRAGPDDERLRDFSAPFTLQPRSPLRRPGDSNSLAGDDGLR